MGVVEKERAVNCALEGLSRNEEEHAWLKGMDQKSVAQVAMPRSSRRAVSATGFAEHVGKPPSKLQTSSAIARAEEQPRSRRGPGLNLVPPSLGHGSPACHDDQGLDRDIGYSSVGSLTSSPG